MHTYTFLRELADSWVLLAMVIFFVSVILWVFRPGSTATYQSISQIPLRDLGAPAQNGCATCTCAGTCQTRKGHENV